MTQRPLILLLYWLLVFPFSLLAQPSAERGYIITQAGDSIAGSLANTPYRKMIDGPLFREAGQRRYQLYTSDEIRAFGTIHGRRYEAYGNYPLLTIDRESVFFETIHYQRFTLAVLDNTTMFLQPHGQDTLIPVIGQIRTVTKKTSVNEKFFLNKQPDYKEVLSRHFRQIPTKPVLPYPKQPTTRYVDQVIRANESDPKSVRTPHRTYTIFTPYLELGRGTLTTTLSTRAVPAVMDNRLPPYWYGTGFPIRKSTTTSVEAGLVLTNRQHWDWLGLTGSIRYVNFRQELMYNINQAESQGGTTVSQWQFSPGIQVRPYWFPAIVPWMQAGLNFSLNFNRNSHLVTEFSGRGGPLAYKLDFPEMRRTTSGMWMKFGFGLISTPLGQLNPSVLIRRSAAYAELQPYQDRLISEVRFGLSWRFCVPEMIPHFH